MAIRQQAHIVAEGNKTKPNLMQLCPSCHVIFDTQVKPKLYVAFTKAGTKNLPASWKKSIYTQAAEASQKARSKRK